jgi:hypothetical protein
MHPTLTLELLKCDVIMTSTGSKMAPDHMLVIRRSLLTRGFDFQRDCNATDLFKTQNVTCSGFSSDTDWGLLWSSR